MDFEWLLLAFLGLLLLGTCRSSGGGAGGWYRSLFCVVCCWSCLFGLGCSAVVIGGVAPQGKARLMHMKVAGEERQDELLDLEG